MKRIVYAALAATCLAAPAQAASVADPFTSFFVLGDSLSDPGNVPEPFWSAATGGAPFYDAPDDPITPQVESGTFSSGPVWADVLKLHFGAQFKPTFNVASGGASTGFAPSGTGNDLDTQQATVETILGLGAGGARPLMSYWFGANDIFDAYGAAVAGGTGDFSGVFTAAAGAAGLIADAIGRSITLHGVSDFLVMNLPDFALIPRFSTADPLTKAFATSVTDTFNAALIAELGVPAATGANITVLDVNLLLTDLVANPSDLGYTNITDACVTTSGGVRDTVCPNVNEYLFIDEVHPTAPAHEAIGAAAAAALTPVPLPAGVWLLLGGVGALALRRRAA